MSRLITVLTGLALAIVLLAAAAYFAAPRLQRAFFYPSPPPMPAVVAEDMEDLLERLEAILAERAPKVLEALEPGLSEEEVAEVEEAFGIVLPEEVRALYRWRNGQAAESTYYILPGHRFMPLGEALAERQLMREQLERVGAVERAAFNVFVGHRKGWLTVFDFAGDGYFVDLDRSDRPGYFFFSMTHAIYYEFFPSVRNFLAGLIECYSAGAIWFDEDEDATWDDFEATETIWAKYSAATE